MHHHLNPNSLIIQVLEEAVAPYFLTYSLTSQFRNVSAIMIMAHHFSICAIELRIDDLRWFNFSALRTNYSYGICPIDSVNFVHLIRHKS